MEEEKLDKINDEDIHYDREDGDFQKSSWENYGTGVDRLQPRME